MSLELTVTDGIIMVGLDDRILSCQCHSTAVVNMVSERVSHHIALPLYIGQFAMHANTACVDVSYLDLPHRGKTVVVGPKAGSTWGG
jgi:hypothetical protein